MRSRQKIIFLGDSYTIGEGIEFTENFPSKFISKLNESTQSSFEGTVIAKTGWTSGELIGALSDKAFENEFIISTLLIGVNNQYRELDISTYQKEFELVLSKAISFVVDPTAVVVISIPDWGITPFASGRDQQKIAKEIDEYNSINRKIATKFKTYYLDITTGNRERGRNPAFLASDGLHPSSLEYDIWSSQLLSIVIENNLHSRF